MSGMHPPASRKCQIYVGVGGPELQRCTNEGTHWEKWGGDIDEFHSWECDGDHVLVGGEAA